MDRGFVGEKSVIKEDFCGSTSPSCWRALLNFLEGTFVIVSVLALCLRLLLVIKWGSSYCLGEVAAICGVVSIVRLELPFNAFGNPISSLLPALCL